jgi:hypothetical protein
MAFSASGLYILNFIDIFDTTQMAINLSLDSHKIALYLDALTPNYSTGTVYSATSESSGAGYSAGGKVITGLTPTLTESPSGTVKYDMNDQSWASATITAHGMIEYADALTDELILGMTFGADYVSTNGTFTVQFHTNGVATFDLTP